MIEPSFSPATPAPEEDVTTALYRAAIGPVNSHYYLPIFSRFEAADHAGISWNHAASLATLNWLVFRKLWVAALAYVGILVAVAVLVFGMGHLVFQLSDTLMLALALGFGLAAFVLPGLFGNAVLHTECRKNMAKALAAHTQVADACADLARQASTRWRAVWLVCANAAFLLAAVFLYVQFSTLSTLAVMPQGALEAGHVAVGRSVESTASGMVTAPISTGVAALNTAMPGASAPSMAITASEHPLPPASANALPVAPTASAPSTLVATAGVASAMAPAATASGAKATTAMASAPATPSLIATNSSAPSTALPIATAIAAASTPAPAASAPQGATAAPATRASKASPKASAAQPSTPAVQQRVEKVSDKAAQATKAQEKTQGKVAAASAPKRKPSAPATPSTADATNKPYYINVGLFAKPENAAKAHAKLLEAQLPSVSKALKASKLNLTRVRVGPFSTRSEAESAVEKIKALQMDAVIVQL